MCMWRMDNYNEDSGCDVCKTLMKRKKEICLQEEDYLTLDVAATVINKSILRKHSSEQKKWKEDRDNFVCLIKIYLSALRNSRGGALLLHVKGLDPADRNLDHFHELVDVRLNDMIEDGSLFVVTYKKNWLPFANDEFSSFIEIIVTPSVYVVTVDFKTKNPLDNAIVDPTNFTVIKLLETVGCEHGYDSEAVIRGIQGDDLQESRCLMIKGFHSQSEVNTENGILSIVDYIWEKLKFKYYITSFSKLDHGGSFYLGIVEKDTDYKTYTSKSIAVRGFTFSSSLHETFKTALKQKVKDETFILKKKDCNFGFIQTVDLIKMEFHSVDGEDLYVLEVAVAGVDGIVFYDRKGPEAYELSTDNQIQRMQVEEWCRRFMRSDEEQFQTTRAQSQPRQVFTRVVYENWSFDDKSHQFTSAVPKRKNAEETVANKDTEKTVVEEIIHTETDGCDACSNVKGHLPSSAEHFVLHFDDFRRKDKVKRKKIIQDMEKIVCALRNSEGGEIFIHLSAQSTGDRYLGHFDELVYSIFPSVTEFGEMAIDEYKRTWLCDRAGFEMFHDFLALAVQKSNRLHTTDFNTRIPNDFEIARPSHSSLISLLSQNTTHKDTCCARKPRIVGIPRDLQDLHERRNVQLKAYRPEQAISSSLESDAEALAKYIWFDLKLRENLTSMSKIHGGGSYYGGIHERRASRQTYDTVIPDVQGFPMNMSDSMLTQQLQKLAKDNLRLCHKGFTLKESPADLFEICLHPLETGNRILEVAIRYCEGIVFYDSCGPISYIVKNGRVVRMDWEEWIWRLMIYKNS